MALASVDSPLVLAHPFVLMLKPAIGEQPNSEDEELAHVHRRHLHGHHEHLLDGIAPELHAVDHARRHDETWKSCSWR